MPFAGALFGGFVYDDHVLIEPPSPAPHAWSEIWKTGLWGEMAAAQYYRPLVAASFLLDRAIGDGGPFVPHLTGLLLHLALVVAAWRLLRAVTGSEPVSLAAAAIFAVHPVHVEATAWISGRGDLLAPLLGFCAWLVFLRATAAASPARRWAGLGAASVLLLAALLAKESAVAIPLLAAVALAAAGGRHRRSLLAGAATALPAILVWLALRAAALPQAGLPVDPLENPAAGLPLADHLATAARALVTGLRLLCWPAPLRVDYSLPVLRPVVATSAAGLASLLVLAAAIACSFALARGRRRDTDARLIGIGGGLLLTAWLPVSSLMLFPGSLLAERYLVLPSFGFALAAAAGLRRAARLLPGAGPAAFVAPVLALVFLFAALSAMRIPDWRDDRSLLTADIAHPPVSYKVYYMLGLGHLAAGDLPAAQDALDRCLGVAPQFSRAHEAVARVSLAEAHPAAALAAVDRALAAAPAVPALLARYRVVRGEALAALGRRREAESDFRDAAVRDPGSATALRLLGDLLFAASRREDAGRAYREAVRRDPEDAVAVFNLGLTLALLERHEEATTVFSRLLTHPERPIETLFHLGVLAEIDARLEAALSHFDAFLAGAAAKSPAAMRDEAARRADRLRRALKGAAERRAVPRDAPG